GGGRGVGGRGEEGGGEVGLRADAVRDRRESGPVLHRKGRLLADPRAAAARARARRAHLPPPALTTSTPCSGKLGSSSSRAISSRPIDSTPVSSALEASSRWRWNAFAVTDSTPGTACAAATIAER